MPSKENLMFNKTDADLMFNIYVPAKIYYSQESLLNMRRTICNLNTNYEEVDLPLPDVVAYVGIETILNIHDAGLEIYFVDEKDIPLFYQYLFILIKRLKLNNEIEENFTIINLMYDVADTLYDEYKELLKRFFYKQIYGNVQDIRDMVTYDEMIFKKLERL